MGKKSKKKGGHKVVTALNVAAASVIMGVNYAARIARYDLIKPVQRLATELHAWDEKSDKKLHRLMCYVWH